MCAICACNQLQFIDFSDNGTIERLCNSSSALISRMLQNALSPNLLLRANRNACLAPTASQWARGMYAPASRLNHFVTLFLSTTLEVLPICTPQRQLLLPLCGICFRNLHIALRTQPTPQMPYQEIGHKPPFSRERLASPWSTRFSKPAFYSPPRPCGSGGWQMRAPQSQSLLPRHNRAQFFGINKQDTGCLYLMCSVRTLFRNTPSDRKTMRR